MGRRRQRGLVYRRSLPLQTILALARNKGFAHAIAISCCILTAASVGAAAPSPPNAVAEIQSVLRAQQDAWNRGDIDEFMNGTRDGLRLFLFQMTRSRAVGKPSARLSPKIF